MCSWAHVLINTRAEFSVYVKQNGGPRFSGVRRARRAVLTAPPEGERSRGLSAVRRDGGRGGKHRHEVHANDLKCYSFCAFRRGEKKKKSNKGSQPAPHLSHSSETPGGAPSSPLPLCKNGGPGTTYEKGLIRGKCVLYFVSC